MRLFLTWAGSIIGIGGLVLVVMLDHASENPYSWLSLAMVMLGAVLLVRSEDE